MVYFAKCGFGFGSEGARGQEWAGNREKDFVAGRDISGHRTGGAAKAGRGGCGVA